MNAIIVGHGPSILAESMGHLIDEYDYVIRLKRCHETLKDPEHFGTKTSVVGCSLNIASGVRDIETDSYWVFVDSRHEDVSQQTLSDLPYLLPNCIIDKPLCDAWDQAYRDMRTPVEFSDQMKPSRSSDEFGERHLSQGFKAILYAAKYLGNITLVGFDNICTGEFNWSLTRGPEWDSYPKHRWDVENKMIPMVEKEFNIKINYLLPEGKCLSL